MSTRPYTSALKRLRQRSRLIAIWRWSLAFRLVSVMFLVIMFIIAGLYFAIRWVPFNETKLSNLDVSTVVYDRNGSFLRAYLSNDQRWRIPAELETISPWMLKATLAAEDKRFYQHSGIDYRAIARALWLNLKSGRIKSGASTISMQVAGFAIESRERTITRKLSQAFLALQLEHHWTKDHILKCYLTHASYGGNVCGVEAAARRYFNKTAAEMSAGESALLAGIPQSPERFRPDRNLNAAMRRREYVLTRLHDQNQLALNDYNRIRKMKVPIGTYDVPVLAPHFTDYVHSVNPDLTRIHTTLNLDIQQAAETSLQNTVKRNRAAGVTNGAVIVLSNSTAEVLAMVGSADYWNKFDQGQVNGSLGFRSPGSALKPLIFGLAFDRGVLEPDEILFDVPITIGGYSPVNYDRKFRGPVSAAKALAWSLNIPAMEVLNRLGIADFQEMTHSNGMTLQINDTGDPGLSLAIGTCSVRLLDLTAAYASLASGGTVITPRSLMKSDRISSKRKWLSGEASDAILNILSDPNVRAPQDVDPHLTGLNNVAWKTGTSNGFRDAWTIAVTRDYTVGVWLGNMNGTSSRALVGGEIAAPIALNLARELSHGKSLRSVSLDGMEQKPACLQSGLAPGPYCFNLSSGRFLKGTLTSNQCRVHRLVQTDRTSGFELCSRCSQGHTVSGHTCAIYPASVSSWLRLNHHPWADNLRPAHNSLCSSARQGDPPVIITPASGTEVILLKEIPVQFQLIGLSARTDDPTSKLFWFVDETLVGTGPASEAIQIQPVPGRHKLKCVDSRGQSTEGWFSVESSEKVENDTEIGMLNTQ